MGIVFRNPDLYAGGIKDVHSCPGRIDCLTDWFSKINEAMKKGLQIFEEILFEAGDFRSIGNLVETTEFTEMPGILKENKEQGICWD